jgi:hypothetical protein
VHGCATQELTEATIGAGSYPVNAEEIAPDRNHSSARRRDHDGREKKRGGTKAGVADIASPGTEGQKWDTEGAGRDNGSMRRKT